MCIRAYVRAYVCVMLGTFFIIKPIATNVSLIAMYRNLTSVKGIEILSTFKRTTN